VCGGPSIGLARHVVPVSNSWSPTLLTTVLDSKVKYLAMPHILCIPGAFSTCAVFNYLRIQVPHSTWTGVNYNHHARVQTAIQHLLQVFDQQPSKFHVIAHSMGGLLALHTIDHEKVLSVCTISTPLKGLPYYWWQKWVFSHRLLYDVHEHQDWIQAIHTKVYHKPVHHLISTMGDNPWHSQPNDGVITIDSQLKTVGSHVCIATNHWEILMHDQTVQELNNWYVDTHCSNCSQS